MREVLASDPDGRWTEEFARHLDGLADGAESTAARMTSDDLRRRCSVLVEGARIAVLMLPALRQRLVPKPMPHTEPRPTPDEMIPCSTETTWLYSLGCLALETGLHDEGLAIVQAVGTLLHGQAGGALFEAEALMALGNVDAAARALEDGMCRETEVDSLASTTMMLHWMRRPNGPGQNMVECGEKQRVAL